MKEQYLKTRWKAWIVGLIALLLLAASALMPAASAIKYDHLWLVVSPDAPERAALERADGRHLAILGTSSEANVWTIDNF